MEPKMRLREWLVAQIDSGRYAGLNWEEDNKTMFRIPWKHASKHDYKQNEDAALFKAWAMYKGKYREGKDKNDPTVWKTRLRCALNKSTDFQEVPERSQLDISEPYKVYHVQEHAAPDEEAAENQVIIQATRSISPARSPSLLKPQLGDQRESCEENEAGASEALLREHMYCWAGGGTSHSTALILRPSLIISDFCMQVRLFYQGRLVTEVITSSPDGCFILQGGVPLGSERIYGPCSAEQLSFPSPSLVPLQAGIVEAMKCLLPHLERGVLLWVAPEGVFIKRFCQGRVYWSGPLAHHTDRPNKLERERTCKLLDVPIFLKELQTYLQGDGPAPCYEIELCFGEEFPDPNVSKTKKLVIVQVVPLFAVKLLQRVHLEETEEKWAVHTPNTQREERRRRHPKHPERGEEEEIT